MTIALLAAAGSAGDPGPAEAEMVEADGTVAIADAALAPQRLPRTSPAPVSVSVSGSFATVDGDRPPALQRLEIAINRHGRLDPRRLPSCPEGRLINATSEEALRGCGRARVGEGRMSSRVEFPETAPLPADGRVLLFNSRGRRGASVLAHVFGREPVPQATVLRFRVRRGEGKWGVRLVAPFPPLVQGWGYVSSYRLRLGGSAAAPGGRRYLTGSCAVPRGIAGAVFPLARLAYSFDGAPPMALTLERLCRAAG
jgi:hypothetical protein